MAQLKSPKSIDRLLSDCESQLKFLEEALTKYDTEPDRYKQIAGVLRVLVCEIKKTNDPLLLDLLDYFGLQYHVRPIPDLPFPIPMVGDTQEPPENFELSPEEIWEHYRKIAKPVPLRDFVNRGLAVFIAPREFSYLDLVRMVAEQSGTAHEDTSVDQAFADLEQFFIGGYSGYGAPVRQLAQLVLDTGRKLIHYAQTHHNYQPHYFTDPTP